MEHLYIYLAINEKGILNRLTKECGGAFPYRIVMQTQQRTKKGKPRKFAGKVALVATAVLATDAAAVSSHVSPPESVPSSQKGSNESASSMLLGQFMPKGLHLCYSFGGPGMGNVKQPAFVSVSSLKNNLVDIPVGWIHAGSFNLPGLHTFRSGKMPSTIRITKSSGGFYNHYTLDEMFALVQLSIAQMSDDDRQWVLNNPVYGYGGTYLHNGVVYVPRTANNNNTLVIEGVPIEEASSDISYAACLNNRM